MAVQNQNDFHAISPFLFTISHKASAYYWKPLDAFSFSSRRNTSEVIKGSIWVRFSIELAAITELNPPKPANQTEKKTPLSCVQQLFLRSKD